MFPVTRWLIAFPKISLNSRCCKKSVVGLYVRVTYSISHGILTKLTPDMISHYGEFICYSQYSTEVAHVVEMMFLRRLLHIIRIRVVDGQQQRGYCFISHEIYWPRLQIGPSPFASGRLVSMEVYTCWGEYIVIQSVYSKYIFVRIDFRVSA